MSTLRTTHHLMKIMNNAVVDLPAPLKYFSLMKFWIFVGVVFSYSNPHWNLSCHTLYTPCGHGILYSVVHIVREVNCGWLLCTIHANGASFFFFCLYLHVGRGLNYGSYLFMLTWFSGILLLLLTMGAAFEGYVLLWEQMSFWGATVITNLLSAMPYMGDMIVQWMWEGFAVNNATLNSFFSFHFLIPFLILGVVMIYLLFLHQTGSNNPLGLKSDSNNKIPFHPYFTIKDLVGFMIILSFLILLTFLSPNLLGDPENCNPANPLVTQVHIQPEWYFLFAYAIFRSIPNKLERGSSPLTINLNLSYHAYLTQKKHKGVEFYPIIKFLFWSLIGTVFILTWISAKPVEDP